MPHAHRMLLAAALTLVAASPTLAQKPADPSGHWEGSLHAPGMEIPFAVDLAGDGQGHIAGTVTLQAERIKGLPLLKVTVEGTSIGFYARTDQPLTGTLSADGMTISGDYFAEGTTVPFTLTRKGDAAIDATPTSPAIAPALEGTWRAVVAARGQELHVVLTLQNRGDGRATAQLVNLDQGGLRIPLLVSERDGVIALSSTVVPTAFKVSLNAAGELAGRLNEGSASLPIVFRRAAANDR